MDQTTYEPIGSVFKILKTNFIGSCSIFAKNRPKPIHAHPYFLDISFSHIIWTIAQILRAFPISQQIKLISEQIVTPSVVFLALPINYPVTVTNHVCVPKKRNLSIFRGLKGVWKHTEYPGKSRIFDGRTGSPFEQPVIKGKSYILKLIHQVDDKIYGHSGGHYALVTQPLRGRAKQGGSE